MPDYFQNKLGLAIVSRMKNSGKFDALLGGSGSTLDVEYVQQELHMIAGPQGRCKVMPGEWEDEQFLDGAVRANIEFRLLFDLDDVTGTGLDVPKLRQALVETFMDEDRAVLTTELAAIDTGANWLGRSGSIKVEVDPLNPDETDDKPVVEGTLRFEMLTHKQAFA